MYHLISIVGIDGSGKSTLIKKIAKLTNIHTGHQNYFIKHLYPHRKSYIWEWLNLIEVVCRHMYWRCILHYKPLLLDRCYICGLVYSNLEGVPAISHLMKKWTVKPDMVCLIEPVEELVPDAYRFTREYKRVLIAENYRQIKRGFHEFGRTSFWIRDESPTQLLLHFISIMGSA